MTQEIYYHTGRNTFGGFGITIDQVNQPTFELVTTYDYFRLSNFTLTVMLDGIMLLPTISNSYNPQTDWGYKAGTGIQHDSDRFRYGANVYYLWQSQTTNPFTEQGIITLQTSRIDYGLEMDVTWKIKAPSASDQSNH